MCAIFVKILRTPPFPHLKHNSEHAVPLLNSPFSNYQLPTESHSCSLAWCWRQGLNWAGHIWSYRKYACFLCFFLWSCQRVILVFPAQTVNPVLVPVPMNTPLSSRNAISLFSTWRNLLLLLESNPKATCPLRHLWSVQNVSNLPVGTTTTLYLFCASVTVSTFCLSITPGSIWGQNWCLSYFSILAMCITLDNDTSIKEVK